MSRARAIVSGAVIFGTMFIIAMANSRGGIGSTAYTVDTSARDAYSQPKEDKISHSTYAQISCRSAVYHSLKSPDSAKFQDQWNDYIKETRPNHFHVQTKAYATNSFGASILETFDCRVTCVFDKKDPNKSGCATTKLDDLGALGSH